MGGVLRGHRAVGGAAGPAQRQRAQLLREAPRVRGPLRTTAPHRRRGRQDLTTVPPPDLRQGRTIPADPQEVAPAATPRRHASRSYKPTSTPSSPTTTTSDPTAASAASPPPNAGPPPHQRSTSASPCPAQPRTAPPSLPTTASSASAATASPSAANGAAAPPASTTTTPTPPSSSTTASCAPSNSTPPGATSPPDSHADADPPNIPLSEMSRDNSVRHVARHRQVVDDLCGDTEIGTGRFSLTT